MTEPPDETALPIETAPSPILAGQCYRCGYNLLGIADDQPCPECGLLAIRSRRITDELHNTRPKWLHSMFIGARLILLAAALVFATLFFSWALGEQDYIIRDLFSETCWILWAAATLFLSIGVCFLSRREGYPPADRADRGRRWAMRVFALVPMGLLAMIFMLHRRDLDLTARDLFQKTYSDWADYNWILIALIAPLPWNIFRQLRSIAHRARSAHLAEHCAIAGAGATFAVLYIAAMSLIVQNAEDWWGEGWLEHSRVSLWLIVLAGTAAVTFLIWSLYILGRFARSFRRAVTELNFKWSRDDRATE